MATNPKTLAKVKELTQKVEKFSKDSKALKAKLDFTIKELEAQIKIKGSASINMLLTALETQTAQLEALLIPLRDARKLADEIGQDSGYTADHVQTVVKLTKQIDDGEASVIALVKTSRTLEISAEKSLGEGASAEDKGELQLSKIAVNTRFRDAEMQKAVPKLKAFEAAADAARDGRSAPKLKAAKVGARSVVENQRKYITEIDEQLTQFRADYMGKSTSAAARARWEAEIKDLQKGREKIGAMLEACDLMLKQIDQIALVVVDPKKAATAAGIDTAHAAELDKAMKGDDATRLKNLEALVKKLNLKVSGKEMFTRLRKAKHI